MKKLNTRLVAVVVGVLLVTVVLPGTWLLVRRGRRPNVAPLLAAAAQKVAAGDADDALVRYRRILQLDPKCAAAHLALGELLEKCDDLNSAAEHYATALRLQPADAEAARRLGNVAERVGANSLLREAADRLIALAPEESDGHYWKALVLGANRDYDAAIAEAKQATSAAPAPVKALILLGELYQAKGDFGLCDHTYGEALKAYPNDMDLLLAIGRFHETRKDKAQSVEKAKAAIEKAVAAYPDAPAPRLHLAALLARQNQLEEAEKHLKLAVERNPTHKGTLAAYGDFLVRAGRLADARRHFEHSLEVLKDWPDGHARLVEVLLDLGEVEAAKSHFEKLPAAAEDSVGRKYLEGRLLAGERKPAEAVAKLREVVTRSPRFAEAHFYMGLAYLDLGELGSARASFEEAGRRNPFAMAPQRQIAVTALALGDPEAAIEAARKVVAAAPQDPAMRQLLARALAAKGDLTGAAEQLDAARKQATDPVTATLELASLRASERRYPDAIRLIEALPAEAKASARARLVLASIYMAADDLERAQAELIAAVKDAPEDIAPRTALASLYIRRGEADNARGVLEEFAKSQPKSVSAQLALAACYEHLGGVPRALEACRRAEALDPASAEVAERVIGVLLAMKQPEEALAAAKKLAAAKPERLSARLTVPRVLLTLKKWNDAVPILEELAKDHPNEASPADLLGRAYLGQNDLRRAIEQLRKAAGLRQDWLETCHLLADACYRSGEYQEAISWSERIIQRRPDIRSAHLISALSHAERDDFPRAIQEYLAAQPREAEADYFIGLAGLYERDGKHGEAEKALLKAQQLQPTSPTTVFALVRHYAMLGKLADADALVAKLPKEARRDPAMLVVLGRERQAAGYLADAEEAFREAIELDAKSASLRVVLGDLLLAAGRPSEATAAYREALRLDSSEARPKIIESLLRSGRFAEAWKELGTASKALPSDAGLRIVEARLLLAEAEHQAPAEKLAACRAACEAALRADPSKSDAHVLLADSYLAERPPRRDAALAALQRAVQLSRGTSLTSVRLARLLLDLGRPADAERECRRALSLAPGLGPALETLALAMAKGRPEVTPQAIAAGLAPEFPTNPARHLLLGEALARQSKWPEAAAEYRACLAEAPGTVQALAGLAQTLTRAGEPTKAAMECQSFLEQNPNSPAAFELLGRVHLASKQPLRAAEAYEAASRLDPSEHRFFAEAARAYLAAGSATNAMACCQAYIAKWPQDPKGPSTLGSLLAAQGKLTEAESEFSKAHQLDPDNLDVLWQLTSVRVQQKRYDVALAACNAYQRAHPNGAHPWHYLARVHLARGDLVAAETCLEAALRIDGALVGAHSDLASLHLGRGRYEQAAAQFQQVLATQPDRVDALNNLAWCLGEAGKDLDQAKAIAAKALAANPDVPNTLDTFGWICFKRREYDEAAKALRRSLELRPDSPTSRYHLGAILAAQDKGAEAKAELDRALAADAPFPDAEAARALLQRLAKVEAPTEK